MQGHREDQGCRGREKDPAFGTSPSLSVRVAVRWATSASRDGPARGRGQGRGLAGTSGSSFPSPAGTLSCEEEVAPLAGQALNPCPRGSRHVHPHLPHPCQLSQHQAVHSSVSWRATDRPPRSTAGEMAAGLSRPPCLWRGPAPSHTLYPQAQLALRAREAPPQPPAEQKFQAFGSSQGHKMSGK